MQSEATIRPTTAQPADEGISRTDTALRALYSLIFAAVAQLVAWMIAMLVIFQTIFAFATKREPHGRVQAFGDSVSRYLHQVCRYVTRNEDEPPFPFSDLPSKRT